MFGKCFQLNALSKLSSISKTNADRVESPSILHGSQNPSYPSITLNSFDYYHACIKYLNKPRIMPSLFLVLNYAFGRGGFSWQPRIKPPYLLVKLAGFKTHSSMLTVIKVPWMWMWPCSWWLTGRGRGAEKENRENGKTNEWNHGGEQDINRIF